MAHGSPNVNCSLDEIDLNALKVRLIQFPSLLKTYLSPFVVMIVLIFAILLYSPPTFRIRLAFLSSSRLLEMEPMAKCTR